MGLYKALTDKITKAEEKTIYWGLLMGDPGFFSLLEVTMLTSNGVHSAHVPSPSRGGQVY